MYCEDKYKCFEMSDDEKFNMLCHFIKEDFPLCYHNDKKRKEINVANIKYRFDRDDNFIDVKKYFKSHIRKNHKNEHNNTVYYGGDIGIVCSYCSRYHGSEELIKMISPLNDYVLCKGCSYRIGYTETKKDTIDMVKNILINKRFYPNPE